MTATGRRIDGQIIIYFPSNRPAGKFGGGKVYFDMAEMRQQLGGA